jgi:hypothetical protein
MHKDYFEEARKVACKATCNRAHCGSVIVSRSGKIIGRGYNAPPLGDESQRMCDEIFDTTKKPKSDKTCCVHAEWNAIMDALKHFGKEVEGSTLYFMRVDESGAMTDAGDPYCTVCSRLALESGIAVFGLWNDGPDLIDTNKYNQRSYDFAR